MGYVEPLRVTKEVFLSDLQGEVARQALASYAKESLVEIVSSGQGSFAFDRFVNGREGAAEETVILPGPILYRFAWLSDAARYTIKYLQTRWPVLGPGRKGHYKDNYFILAEGREISIEEADNYNQIYITNDKPYSRKAQVGAKGFAFSKGFWTEAAEAVKREFGKQTLRARPVFINLANGYILRKPIKRGRTVETVLNYPAIILERV